MATGRPVIVSNTIAGLPGIMFPIVYRLYSKFPYILFPTGGKDHVEMGPTSTIALPPLHLSCEVLVVSPALDVRYTSALHANHNLLAANAGGARYGYDR